MTSKVAYWEQYPPPTTGGGGGTGTVTNIATSAPITGGPITTTGTIGVTDFVASGASHARGTVPDPGAVAGATKFLREDATWAVPAGGGGTPASPTNSVQFNNAGAFGGDSNLLWDSGAVQLQIGNTGSILMGTSAIIQMSTSARMYADTSNATQSNRFWFQNVNANANTNFGIMPSGSAGTSTFRAIDTSNPNSPNRMLQVGQSGSVAIIDANVLNGGTQGTLEVRIGGTAKLSFSTAGAATFAGDVNFASDITQIRGQTTTFPAANASGVLTNNGSGTLSWSPVPSSTLQAQEFTSSGTFTVPAGVTCIRVTAIGAGGGGSCSPSAATAGGGGGAGEQVVSMPLLVVPAASVTVTIGNKGTGGAAGQGTAQPGVAGGDTSVAAASGTLYARGGAGGNTSNSGAGGGTGGGTSKTAGTAGSPGTANSPCGFGGASGGGGSTTTSGTGAAGGGSGGYSGGTAGGTVSSQGGGGGGGATPYGAGGNGGPGGSAGSSAASTSYGAGGGGGGGHATTTIGGGDGCAGYVLIEWVA